MHCFNYDAAVRIERRHHAKLHGPAALFFVFGVFTGLVKSNLEILPAIPRFISLYLLMTLGLKRGFSLARWDLEARSY